MNAPLATYRVQFNRDFPFASARGIIPYLARLGISHLYASPVFKARTGSPHGYDIVDPTVINPELGGADGLRSLSTELAARDLSIMLDIVPNHMAYDSENTMLMDVLENGPDSAYRGSFDMDLDYIHENLRGRLLAPFLATHYAEALEHGELRLAYDEAGLSLNYKDLRLPLRMESYIRVFGGDIGPLENALGFENPDLAGFLGTISMLKTLAAPASTDSRDGQFAHTKTMLWSLYAGVPAIKNHMDETIARFNGSVGDPASFDALDDLVSMQYFRPSYWKTAAEEINYRRFFTINGLISLRMEEPRVFDHTHATALAIVADGIASAIRVDHVDGLLDPLAYLVRLRDAAGLAVYIAVEKVLVPGETLPDGWPVQGTTGYDFLNQVNGILCRKENEREFSKCYYRFTRLEVTYDELVRVQKRMIISKHLAGNIDNLANLIKQASANDRYGRDITLYGLRLALVEVMMNFPVYRTYINAESGPSDVEREHIRMAFDKAMDRLPAYGYELNYIKSYLLMESRQSLSDGNRQQVLAFVMTFQQFTAPLMAKGFEDTILYIYNKLMSLNEVGGSPNLFGFTAEQFHSFNIDRVRRWPLSMNATATHDTKRGEDVRARINVLSEIPRDWEARLNTWSKFNRAKKRRRAGGGEMPDRNEEYLIYQTLLGAWPPDAAIPDDFSGRLRDYVIKAAREAQVNTNWINPDLQYERACSRFIERLLADGPDNRFLEDFKPFQRKIAWYGMFNSLSQTLLKIVSPGVPDFYQGAELWDLNLVDPDNRRPVDYPLRERLLASLETAYRHAPRRLLASLLDALAQTDSDLPAGRIKLFLIWRALAVRRMRRELFEQGDYVPLEIEGTHKQCVIAFARSMGERHVIAAVPRFLTTLAPEGEPPLGDVWQDTRLVLPDSLPAAWAETLADVHIAAGPGIAMADLFRHFPCALLVAE